MLEKIYEIKESVASIDTKLKVLTVVLVGLVVGGVIYFKKKGLPWQK